MPASAVRLHLESVIVLSVVGTPDSRGRVEVLDLGVACSVEDSQVPRILLRHWTSECAMIKVSEYLEWPSTIGGYAIARIDAGQMATVVTDIKA